MRLQSRENLSSQDAQLQAQGHLPIIVRLLVRADMPRELCRQNPGVPYTHRVVNESAPVLGQLTNARFG